MSAVLGKGCGRRRLLGPALVLAWALLLVLPGCGRESGLGPFQGWVEGEFVYVASPLPGQLDGLSVVRGQSVAAGAPLFALERGFEEAAVAEAAFGLRQAEDKLNNARKGQRPSEVASVSARLGQARAALVQAEAEHRRRVRLFDERTISEEERDRAVSDYEQKKQRVGEISSDLATSRLGARTDEVRAAEATVEAAQAKLAQTRWNLAQKAQAAPADALVFDTLFRRGEFVPAGKPVAVLLPPGNVKVRFYVPEAVVGRLTLGQTALVRLDGRLEPVRAQISFISPEAEYTPPVIYSSQSRAKLVFLIEARPAKDQALDLHPGQPVDVSVLPEGAEGTQP